MDWIQSIFKFWKDIMRVEGSRELLKVLLGSDLRIVINVGWLCQRILWYIVF